MSLLATSDMVSLGLAIAMVSVAACGGGTMAARAGADAATGSDADGSGAEVEAERGDGVDAADVSDAPVASDVSDAPGTQDLTDALTDAPVAGESPSDAPSDAFGEDRTGASDATDARADLPVEKPAATASWTIAPSAMCAASGAGCMDTGAVGGYQVTASGQCPTASGVQLWFPGGAAPLAAGAYAVKPAAGILDVISMPAGMVGVLAERDEGAGGHARYWGRAGSVTVAAAGASRHVTLSGVTLREETSGVMTTLAADVTCP